MPEEYVQKIIKIAEVKYQLDEEIIYAFMEDIKLCWENGFSPIRVVDKIADRIF